MTASEKVFKALLAGRVIHTRPIDQAEFSTNQIPDAIRKIRNKYGSEIVETMMVTV